MADFRIEAFPPEMRGITPLPGAPKPPAVPGAESGAKPAGEISFSQSMNNFIHDVDKTQKDSADKITRFIAGDITDVHDVMIAVEKAGTSFQLLMELRNKMLDAYNEIKRMST